MNVDVLIASNRVDRDLPVSILKSDIGSGQILVSDIYPLIVARELLISHAESEYIFFLDDDIKYSKGLIPYLIKFMDHDVGACQGISYPQGLGPEWDTAIFEEINKITPVRSIIKDNGISRLYTNNTLIKTKLVKDWHGDLNASGFEDLSLTRHILNKGFKCLKIKTPYLTWHKYSWIKILRNTLKWRNGFFYCVGVKMFSIRLIKMIAHLIRCFILSPLNFRFWIFQSWINICSIISSLIFIIKKNDKTKKGGIK